MTPKPGPKSAPAKEAARARAIQLRRLGHSATEITNALAGSDTPLNRTGVQEILREEGFARLWPRPYAARGGPLRQPLPRARRIDFASFPARFPTRFAGLFLIVPELIALDLPGLVKAAGYPGTRDIPALSYLLSLLTFKLVSWRRHSHASDLADDRASGLLPGLAALPKTTACSTYSYRCQHQQQLRFLSTLGKAMLANGLSAGHEFDLDFHAIMHFGNDPVLEEHYVPRRSQRTASVLTFFAQDSGTHNLVYANADLLKRDQNREVIAFCDYWRELSGADPRFLVFDSKLTTHKVLGELAERGVRFLTLRQRSRGLLAQLQQLPAKAWRSVRLERAGGHRTVQVAEDPQVKLRDCSTPLRQLAVRGLGHEHPTIHITNDHDLTARYLIERYAHRMDVEQRLAEWIRAFHIDALSSSIPLNVDLDVVLSVLAGAVCASFRRRLRSYETATPDTLQRRFFATPGHIQISASEVTVRLELRAATPVLRQAALPVVQVPWWGGRRLRFEIP